MNSGSVGWSGQVKTKVGGVGSKDAIFFLLILG